MCFKIKQWSKIVHMGIKKIGRSLFLCALIELTKLDELLLLGKHLHKFHNRCKLQGQFCTYHLQRLPQLGTHQYMYRKRCSRR